MPQSLMDVLGALGLTLEAVPVKDLEAEPEPEPPRRGRHPSAPSAEGKSLPESSPAPASAEGGKS